MVDAFKGRWKAKLFAKDSHAADAPPEDPRPKTQKSFKLNDDVNEYACLTCSCCTAPIVLTSPV